MILMLYAVQMLFFGLALFIGARPGLDNPGCYRDGWDLFRGICEGIAFVIYLGELFMGIFGLFGYVVASGICSIYCWVSYVGALSQYVCTPQYLMSLKCSFVLHIYTYIL